MARRITPQQEQTYRHARDRLGMSQAKAAAQAGFSLSTAKGLDKGFANNGDYFKLKAKGDLGDTPGPIPRDMLSEVPLAALDDFELFRKRYFGRISMPWQIQAGEIVRERLESDRKEFVVLNCPPGSGKTTLFTHDVAAWITARDRKVRGILGSRGERVAKAYTGNLRRTLERTNPIQGVSEHGEIDADSTLVADYGPFRPPAGTEQWAKEQFYVLQEGHDLATNKEPSWTAFGMDSGSLGWRVDIAIWDDLVTRRTISTAEAIETQRGWFDLEAEKRVEPGGLFLLMGQRLGANDLYRYALSKPGGDIDDWEVADLDTLPRKYHHIKFMAHYDDRCQGNHNPANAVPYQGDGRPVHPSGDCLLDPKRLSWRELSAEARSDAGTYATVYQQADVDPRSVLVPEVWIKGGTDPDSGEVHVGCWDGERAVAELPSGLKGPLVSIASADPSPTNFWSVQWWVIQPETGLRFLMDMIRQRMTAPDLLDWYARTSTFGGVMESWQTRSADLGLPICAWVVEQNAAQRFLLQYDHVSRWMQSHSVRVIGHETHRNKADPKLGVEGLLKPIYRDGLVRLPGADRGGSRVTALKLVEEVTQWPDSNYDDCVMGQWFVEHNWQKIWRPPAAKRPNGGRRPEWMRSRARVAA